MDKFVVKGVPGFDGDYPFDIGSFTMRELHIIKRVAGVRAGELEDAFKGGDSDVILAVAIIAVRRNGKDWEQFERLAWEAEFDALTFVGEPEEDDGNPPTPTPQHADSATDPKPESSGNGSNGDGEDSPEMTLQAIGDRQ